MRTEKPRKSGDFIELYLERYLPANYELKLVPTYRCNLRCRYCYTRPFRRHYPGEMSWRTFRSLASMLLDEGGRQVRFLGGEPTLWGHIDRAIAHLRERGLRSFLLTNGTAAVAELPDEVHLNIEHFCEGALRRRVLDCLESYRARGALVRFRYNIQPSDPRAKVDEILDLARRYDVPSIHLGTAWPHERTRAFGRKVLGTVRAILARGLGCTLGDPMPFCLFSESEREELRETANLSGRCVCGHVPLVNPDGESVFPCQAVGVSRALSSLGALRNVRRAFRHDVGHFVRAVDGRCRSCRHFLSGDCQDGCLGGRAGLIKEAAGRGLGRVVRTDALEAPAAAELPARFRKPGGWVSWREGPARVTCRLSRRGGELRRGDWIAAASPDGRLRVSVLLGLPGEVVALEPDGTLHVQDLSAPAGARLESGASLRGLVTETAVFDLGEREVLAAPALPGEGGRLLPTGAVVKLPVARLAGRVTRFAGDLGSRAPERTDWRRHVLSGPAEVRGLELVAGPGANGLRAEFHLAASRGRLVEVELLDGRSYRPRARALAFQPRDGTCRHAVRLEPGGGGPARPGRCILRVHLGGRLLASRVCHYPHLPSGPNGRRARRRRRVRLA